MSKIRRKRGAITLGFFLLLLGLGSWVRYFFEKELPVLNVADKEKVLYIGVVGTLEGIQPATIQNLTEKFTGSLSFESLVYFCQETQELQPQLAESWTFSEDAGTLTFHLRNQVQFHNGKKLTAEEVKKCWEKSFLQQGDSENFRFIQDIAGSEAFFRGEVPTISGIEARNQDLIITFATPNTLFPYIVTHPLFWVADADSAEGIPAGTGAYQVTQRSTEAIEMTAFPSYYAGHPQFTAVKFLAYPNAVEGISDFQSGALDVLLPLDGAAVAQAEKAGMGDSLQEQPLLEYDLLGLHLGMSPFYENTSFRQALNYMINRKELLRTYAGRGKIPLKSPIGQGLKAYRPQILGYEASPEQAQMLLEDIEYTANSEPKPLLLSFYNGKADATMLESLAEEVRNFGVPVTLREVSWNEYCYQLPRMGYSFFHLNWQAAYPDADAILYPLFHSKSIGNGNYMGFKNPQVDGLLQKSHRTTDTAQRIQLQQKAEDIILNEAPQLWLFQKTLLSLVAARVQGWEINVSGIPNWQQLGLAAAEP